MNLLPGRAGAKLLLVKLLALILVACLSGSALAERRYGEPPPARPHSPLEADIERLVVELARERHREIPRSEPRLEAACADLLRRVPASGPPPNELVEAALRLHGLVEPSPHLLVVTMGPDGEKALLADIRADLPRVLAEARYRLLGVAAAPIGHGAVRVLVALEESGLVLQPLAQALPAGGSAEVRGHLRPPYRHPEAFVTAPDGQATRLRLAGDATRFSTLFVCGRARGRYQLELNGDDRFGPAVLANFPLYCGVPVPRTLPARLAAEGRPVKDVKSAEAELERLLAVDRARARLPPLAVDAKLSAVARAHSRDMQAHGFVGHISPSTGSAADRLARAHIEAELVLENVARAYSPAEAEQGLMDSPGHRANILNRQVTAVGIGAALDAPRGDGPRALLVTQLFTRASEPFNPRSAGLIRRRISKLRRARRLEQLDDDAALDRVAQETATKLAAGKLDSAHAGEPAERALAQLAARYRSLRSVVAVATSLTEFAGHSGAGAAVADADATTLGIGVAPGRPAGQPALFIVTVLGTRR